VVCALCHGTNLSGTPKDFVPAPDLLIVGAYAPGAFRALMRTGKALGGREVGAMSQIARGNLSSFTDDERNSIDVSAAHSVHLSISLPVNDSTPTYRSA
jgi:hypothetical protein